MKQILLILAVVALVGCGESKEAAEARAAAEAQVAAEAKGSRRGEGCRRGQSRRSNRLYFNYRRHAYHRGALHRARPAKKGELGRL